MLHLMMLLILFITYTNLIQSFYSNNFKIYNNKKLKVAQLTINYQFNILYSKNNEEYYEDIDENDDEIDETESDSWMKLIQNIYDKVFFYGLDIPRRIKSTSSSSPLITSNVIKNYKKQQSRISKNNPFLTPSEQLGLYLIESKSMNTNKNDKKQYKNYSNNYNNNQNNRLNNSINKDSIKITNNVKDIEKIIFNLENEKQILNITLDIIKKESGIDNDDNNSNESIDNIYQKLELINQEINYNKIKLITLKTELTID